MYVCMLKRRKNVKEKKKDLILLYVCCHIQNNQFKRKCEKPSLTTTKTTKVETKHKNWHVCHWQWGVKSLCFYSSTLTTGSLEINLKVPFSLTINHTVLVNMVKILVYFLIIISYKLLCQLPWNLVFSSCNFITFFGYYTWKLLLVTFLFHLFYAMFFLKVKC